MRGSFAVWCDSNNIDVDGHPQQFELHFNLWRELPSSPDVLDVGIRVIDARMVKKIYFYVPAALEKNHLSDLFDALKSDNTLSAVFNDTLKIGKQSNNEIFQAIRETNGKLAFTVARIRISEDIKLYHVDENNNSKGTIIEFSEDFCHKLKDVGDHYIRFRIHLLDDLKSLISENYYPHDSFLHATFHKTEITEFRINERRNFGRGLREKFKNTPIIKGVHYILVSSTQSELMRAHADSHKMRRLEPNLWSAYLERLGGADPSQMIIYHWKSVSGGEKGIDDFIALAIFRKPVLNPLALVVATVIFIGALGSSLQALFTAIVMSYWPNAVLSQLVVSVLLIILLVAGFGALKRRHWYQ